MKLINPDDLKSSTSEILAAAAAGNTVHLIDADGKRCILLSDARYRELGAQGADADARHLSTISDHVQRLEEKDRLLLTVNEVASMLLAAGINSYEQALHRSMALIGAEIDVDRVYIWRNHMNGDDLYTTQIYEWSGGAEPQQGNELTVSVPFPGDWYPNLSSNRCVNGIVSTFSRYERKHLMAQGIMSILVVPVFLHGQFWGFVGFDDCRNERLFTDSEETILRSVALLFANSYLRNEVSISHVKAREDALSSARAKTDFLANMSHEIRTPINVITGMANIVRRTKDMHRIHECMDKIDIASRQLLSLIGDVLDMSKIEAGKLALAHDPFNLRAAFESVRSIIGESAAQKGQRFTITLAEGLPDTVIGDDIRLSQILINLLSNAVKFTPGGGEIALEAHMEPEPDEDGRRQLVVSVSDTGIGIDPAEQVRIFSKFEQAEGGTARRFGGTGLGLAICKRLAALMDGDIRVTSTPGAGSRFTVRVWLEVASGAQHAQEGRTAQQHDFSGMHALLVEDIEINREIAVALLEGTGLHIDQAADGKKALDRIQERKAPYDMILMDIHMPVMDGYDATRAIRRMSDPQKARVPIIAMTANAFAEDIRRCLEAGMNDHVAKPIDVEELLDKIALHMGMYAEGQQEDGTG